MCCEMTPTASKSAMALHTSAREGILSPLAQRKPTLREVKEKKKESKIIASFSSTARMYRNYLKTGNTSGRIP